MIDKKFRKLMLECPDVVRASVLSDNQIEMAKVLHNLPTPVYSRDIADYFGITVQNASTQLVRLVNAGYATRREVVSPSGGMEFEYLPTLN